MVRYCSFPGCSNRSNKTPGVSFHKFPTDKHRKLAWLIASGIRKWRPHRFSLLCSAHFKQDDFNLHALKGNRLWACAVPSVFPRCTLPDQVVDIEQGQRPERSRVTTCGSNELSVQSMETNGESLENYSCSYIDPSIFMNATMDIEENELNIATLPAVLEPHKNYNMATPNANRMSFATKNLQMQNQRTCLQVPSTQDKALNKVSFSPPDNVTIIPKAYRVYPNQMHLPSTTLLWTMLEKIMKIIVEAEHSNNQQNIALNSAIRWISVLKAKMQSKAH